MFQEAFNILSKNTDQQQPFNILEISIGCGNNYVYLPKGCSLIGVDTNGMYEKFARNRLESVNRNNTGNKVVLKEFLVESGNELARLNSDSVNMVICTNEKETRDYVKTCKEIYRVLIKVK